MTLRIHIISFESVKPQTIKSIFKAGARELYIDDSENSDLYKIKIENTNFGINILCFLNGRPSYQADMRDCGDTCIVEVINKIAGGKVI